MNNYPNTPSQIFNSNIFSENKRKPQAAVFMFKR
jgi:hypothetical protein